jgi:hypothetical protein
MTRRARENGIEVLALILKDFKWSSPSPAMTESTHKSCLFANPRKPEKSSVKFSGSSPPYVEFAKLMKCCADSLEKL